MTTPPDPAAQPPAPVPDPAPDKAFSQADVDRIVADRLARQKAQFGDYDALKEKASQFDALAEQSKTDLQKAVDAAKAEGRTEAQKAASERLAKAEARAQAAGKMANPALAERLIDVSQFVGADGEPDAEAIGAAIEQLVADEPYLAAQPSGFQGSGGGGPRGGRPGTGPTLTQLIAEAERSGDTKQSMRLKARYAREQRKQG